MAKVTYAFKFTKSAQKVDRVWIKMSQALIREVYFFYERITRYQFFEQTQHLNF